jgi:hypothetical protein
MRSVLVFVATAMAATTSGCYLVHERAVRRDAGESHGGRDSALSPLDASSPVDAARPPGCEMPGVCAGPGQTIFLTQAGEDGCVEIEVVGSDSIGCDGLATPVHVIRCDGHFTRYSAVITSSVAPGGRYGFVEYFDGEMCQCVLSHDGENASVGFTIGSEREFDAPVIQIGLFGRGITYRLRACAS